MNTWWRDAVLDCWRRPMPQDPLGQVLTSRGRERWCTSGQLDPVAGGPHSDRGAQRPATKAGVGSNATSSIPAHRAQQAAFVDKVLAAGHAAGRAPTNTPGSTAGGLGRKLDRDFARSLRRGAVTSSRPGCRCSRAAASSARATSRAGAVGFPAHHRRSVHGELLAARDDPRRQRGLEFRAESFGRQQFMYDPMNYARANDMPAANLGGGGPRVDCKVAQRRHLSGGQIAARRRLRRARQLGGTDPWSLKTLGDRAFCLGVNQYYFHRYAHQPCCNSCRA